MEALILIAAIAGLVWTAALFVRGGLIAGCLAVLFTGSCFGAYFYSVPTGAIPLTVDRALLVALLAAFALYRYFGLTDPKPLRLADWVLFALITVLVVSTFSHDYTIRKAHPVSRLTFYYLMPLAVYWVARQARLTERATLAVFGSLSLFGVYLALTALAEKAGWTGLVFPRYIADEKFGEFFGRARGPILNPAGNGVLLATGLAATLLAWPRCNLLGRAGVLAAGLVISLGMYCTLTRSVWLGAGLTLIIVAGLSLPRQWRAVTLSGTLVAGVLLAAVSWESLLSFKRDKAVSEQDVAESAKLRPLFAVLAWQMFYDRPILGCGYGQYQPSVRGYFNQRSSDLPLEKAKGYYQHNIFLALLTETGLAGAGTFAWLLALWALDGWRLWRSESTPLWARQAGLLFLGMLGAYVANGMFHDVTIMPMINVFLFFLAGVSAALVPMASGSAGAVRVERRDALAVG